MIDELLIQQVEAKITGANCHNVRACLHSYGAWSQYASDPARSESDVKHYTKIAEQAEAWLRKFVTTGEYQPYFRAHHP